jgi:hypothetical protein
VPQLRSGGRQLLDRAEAELLEATDARLRELGAGELREHWPPPQPQRRLQSLGTAAGVTGAHQPASGDDEPLEALRVERRVGGLQDVAGPRVAMTCDAPAASKRRRRSPPSPLTATGPGPTTNSSTTGPRHECRTAVAPSRRAAVVWVEIQTAAVEPSGWRPLASPPPPHHRRPRQRPRRAARLSVTQLAVLRAFAALIAPPCCNAGRHRCCGGGGSCHDAKAVLSRAGGTFVAKSAGAAPELEPATPPDMQCERARVRARRRAAATGNIVEGAGVGSSLGEPVDGASGARRGRVARGSTWGQQLIAGEARAVIRPWRGSPAWRSRGWWMAGPRARSI